MTFSYFLAFCEILYLVERQRVGASAGARPLSLLLPARLCRFTIADIQRIASPIYYETNAITVKTTEAKLIKMRIKTFGNRLYLKDPKYYVGDLSTADVTHDTEGILVNNVYVNNKAHVYKPLEKE